MLRSVHPLRGSTHKAGADSPVRWTIADGANPTVVATRKALP
jgi:hypothetical protein